MTTPSTPTRAKVSGASVDELYVYNPIGAVPERPALCATDEVRHSSYSIIPKENQ